MTDSKFAACCTPAPPSTQVPSGQVENWEGMDVYVNAPADAKSAVILISDVFGFDPPQMRKIADYLSLNGYLALVPDILHGDPLTGGLQNLPTWIQKHQPLDEIPFVKKVEEYITSTKGITKFGLVGFCWGAKVAIGSSIKGLANSLVMFHPSLVTVEDIKASKVPVAVLAAEIDQMTPPAVVEEFKNSTAGTELGEKSIFKVYPKVAHGYAVRYDENNEEAVAAALKAHADMLAFFKENLG